MNHDEKIRVLVLDIPEPRRKQIETTLNREFPNVVLIDHPHHYMEHKSMNEKIAEIVPLITLDAPPKLENIPDVLTNVFIRIEPKGTAALVAANIGLVPVPTKSKTLRTLRKVFPHARFQSVTTKGKQSIQLFYRPPTSREEAPVSNVEIPHNGTEAGACQALLCAAFRTLGMETRWDPKFPGAYKLSPIKGFKGTEAQLPLEMDPAVPVDVEKLGNALADRANGKTDADQSNAAILEAIHPAPEPAPEDPICGKMAAEDGSACELPEGHTEGCPDPSKTPEPAPVKRKRAPAKKATAKKPKASVELAPGELPPKRKRAPSKKAKATE